MKRKELETFANLLKENGFDIYANKNEESQTYFYFVKNNQIGYAQQTSDYSGIDLSTVHKPCREAGTGFSIYRDKTSPTVKDAEDVLSREIPEFSSFRKFVHKYQGWEEYVKREQIIEYTKL